MCTGSWQGYTKTSFGNLGSRREDKITQDVRLEMAWTGFILFRAMINVGML